MNITYKTDKNFTAPQLERLFRSVNWLSANYPQRLEKAINHSDTVISAWDGSQLIGLINAIDDTELTAYIHYLLVDPRYHKMGIGGNLLNLMKSRYEGYLYLLVMAEEKDKVSFYTHHGFETADSSTPLVIRTL